MVDIQRLQTRFVIDARGTPTPGVAVVLGLLGVLLVAGGVLVAVGATAVVLATIEDPTGWPEGQGVDGEVVLLTVVQAVIAATLAATALWSAAGAFLYVKEGARLRLAIGAGYTAVALLFAWLFSLLFLAGAQGAFS